jgi:hypothetical protein
MVGYLKNSENSEDRELALQKPKKEMGGPRWQRCPPTPPGRGGPPTGRGGPRRTRTEMRHDHMTLAKTRTLSR